MLLQITLTHEYKLVNQTVQKLPPSLQKFTKKRKNGMALKRKVKQIGNSYALVIPNEIFDFLNLNPEEIRYKLIQDETGAVFIIILHKDVIAIDEKRFQKQRNSYNILIPKSLYNIWNMSFSGTSFKELELSFDSSPLKWRLSPV